MKINEELIGLRAAQSLQPTRKSGRVRALAVTRSKGICLGILAASFTLQLAFAADHAGHAPGLHGAATTQSDRVPAQRVKRVNFNSESASEDARHVADWVIDSGDNRSMPFVIADKADAKVFVFHADGRLRGAAPMLLGMGRGDDSAPGIGTRKLSTISPEERTTPAGRFVAALGRNLHGGEILWVDYEAAFSLHPVITSNKKEMRGQRLATPTTQDNRISYGCINVPVKFFKRVVSAAFRRSDGIVYVLPETRSARKVFNSYDVDQRVPLQSEKQGLPAQLATQIDTGPV